MVIIYTLSDPDSGQVMYVGKSVNPTKRLKSHVSNCDGGVQKRKWVAELKSLGKQPIMNIVDIVENGDDWRTREKEWIHRYFAENPKLLNVIHKPVKQQKTTHIRISGDDHHRLKIAALFMGIQNQEKVTLSKMVTILLDHFFEHHREGIDVMLEVANNHT